MKLPSVRLVLPPTTFPSKSPLLLATPGFPSEARLSLVLRGPLPTLQTSPPASGRFETQPTPPRSHFPCVAPSCAACLFLSPHLFPSLPGSWAAASSGRQACRQAWGCFSALCSLASGTGLGPGRPRAPHPVSGRAAPPRAEPAWWGGTGPASLPCLGSTPRPQTEGLLPLCL